MNRHAVLVAVVASLSALCLVLIVAVVVLAVRPTTYKVQIGEEPAVEITPEEQRRASINLLHMWGNLRSDLTKYPERQNDPEVKKALEGVDKQIAETRSALGLKPDDPIPEK